ncbi:MAG: GNAT family N-acetyltransferase [Bauldia sp.]
MATDLASLSAPSPLLAAHDVSGFSCGHDALDAWLKERALKSEGRSARTFVVLAGQEVVGYYSLATGSVARETAPRKIRVNAPDPIPIALIGRLAVDRRLAGHGIGSAMLADGLKRILQLSLSIGCAAAVVHAIDEKAIGFYQRMGFVAWPPDGRTLFLPLETISAALGR